MKEEKCESTSEVEKCHDKLWEYNIKRLEEEADKRWYDIVALTVYLALLGIGVIVMSQMLD